MPSCLFLPALWSLDRRACLLCVVFSFLRLLLYAHVVAQVGEWCMVVTIPDFCLLNKLSV